MPRLAPTALATRSATDDLAERVDPEPTVEAGLTAVEVGQRVADGRVNVRPDDPRHHTSQIVASNVLSPVNGIMLTLFVLIGISGFWKDALFVGVVFSNTVVGIGQELRARRELSQLKVLTEPAATVIRAGRTSIIPSDEVVEDDLVEVTAGHQVVVDGVVADVVGLTVDESLLTGESLPVSKAVGDPILSGSFITAGRGRFRATDVGTASYAGALATEARRFSMVGSRLRGEISRIIRWLLIIVPIASFVLWLSLHGTEDSWQVALQGTVAAAVSMVPDGLVLLTSVAFVAGVVTLSRHKALAKQLATVESLARVDVLCLDKTGTITTGDIAFVAATPLGIWDTDEVLEVLAAFVGADPAPSATSRAISKGVGSAPGWHATAVEPFNSDHKWSAASFEDHGAFVLGAPDVLLADDDPLLSRVAALSATGSRVLLLAAAPATASLDVLPRELAAVAIVELADEVRPDAPQVINYFAQQNVTLKVISGDNTETVSAVARRADVAELGAPLDARLLPPASDPTDEMADALESGTVFGRVTPHQKMAMVASLQARGHVVAMTGDGVNDVLALKQADLGIAMGNGSSATRAIADLVLTDNSFATLPVVVDEGRKVINNVERVANLFVTKTAYAVLLTVVVALAGLPFPLLPRQLTLIGTFSIGLPGFFLALSPEVDRVRDGFLGRVLSFSLPAGLIAGSASMAVYAYCRDVVGLDVARTMTTLTLLAIGLVVLAVTSRPLRAWKLALVVGMGASYALICSLWFLRDYFELHFTANAAIWGSSGAAVAVGGAAVVALAMILDRRGLMGRQAPR